MLSLLLTAAMAASAGAPAWHDGLDWHGVHVAFELKPAQAWGQRGREAAMAHQPVDLRIIEAQSLQMVQGLLQAGGHEEVAARWQLAHEQLEHSLLLKPFPKIGLQHRELVEVREQGAHC